MLTNEKTPDRDWRLGLYEKAMPNALSFSEKLRCAKRHGYDFLEMSIDESDEKLQRLDAPRGERASFVRAMEREALPVRTICLSGHRRYPLGSEREETRTRGSEMLQKAVRLADDLGVRIIQLAGYDVYYEPSTRETRRYFLENLEKSVRFAAKYGVILAFETMETPFMNTAEKAMQVVSMINSPYLQVYPDVGNCTNAAGGGSVAKDLSAAKGHIAAVHLKETKPGVFREVPFGEGHVDFESAVSAALGLGVRMFVTEFWDRIGVGYEGQIGKSKAFIDEIFRRVRGE